MNFTCFLSKFYKWKNILNIFKSIIAVAYFGSIRCVCVPDALHCNCSLAQFKMKPRQLWFMIFPAPNACTHTHKLTRMHTHAEKSPNYTGTTPAQTGAKLFCFHSDLAAHSWLQQEYTQSNTDTHAHTHTHIRLSGMIDGQRDTHVGQTTKREREWEIRDWGRSVIHNKRSERHIKCKTKRGREGGRERG